MTDHCSCNIAKHSFMWDGTNHQQCVSAGVRFDVRRCHRLFTLHNAKMGRRLQSYACWLSYQISHCLLRLHNGCRCASRDHPSPTSKQAKPHQPAILRTANLLEHEHEGRLDQSLSVKRERTAAGPSEVAPVIWKSRYCRMLSNHSLLLLSSLPAM